MLAAATLMSCGFDPALAPTGSAAGMRGDFAIDTPNSRSGFLIARQLEQRLGLPSSPEYRLRVAITEGSQVTGIPADRVTTRANLLGRADYTVERIATDEVVQRGSVRSFTGFSTTSTTAATRAAREDAGERLMTILADRVVADLLATSEEWRR